MDRFTMIVKYQDKLAEIEEIKKNIVRLARVDKITDLKKAVESLRKTESELNKWLKEKIK